MGKTRVVFIDPKAKVNSSYYCNIVLEKGLLAARHQSNMSSSHVNTAAGWHASAHCPDHDKLSEKEHINFIDPHMWPPNSPDINPVDYAIWGTLQQPLTTIQDGGRTEASDSHRVVKTLHSVSLITVYQ